MAAGASGRASGLVGFLGANHAGQAALLKASADLYYNWQELIGGAPAINQVGVVLPVPATEREALEREVGVMQAAGHDTRLVDAAALAELAPGWSLDDVAVAAYSPGSGYIDPPMATTALMNRARSLGVRVYAGADVTAIRVSGGKVQGLESNRGSITAPVVVIAAGAWSAPLGRLVGAELNVWPVRHQVMHLKPPADAAWPVPGCADPSNSVYFRPEAGGLVLAANSGPDDYPGEPDGDPEQFDSSVSDWYARWIVEHLARRWPAMREARSWAAMPVFYPKGTTVSRCWARCAKPRGSTACATQRQRHDLEPRPGASAGGDHSARANLSIYPFRRRATPRASLSPLRTAMLTASRRSHGRSSASRSSVA